MSSQRSPSTALYRTIWRWHFYAGLIVAPFTLVLAITGAIYLFNDEINDLLHHDLRIVSPYTQAKPASRLVAAALEHAPGGTVTRIDMPKKPNRSVEVFVTPGGGDPIRVFVDPGTAAVLGSYVYSRTLVGFADIAHGSLMLGTYGDNIVELAACWAFILTVTGLYLWWPRPKASQVETKARGGVFMPRLAARGRVFWRDLHAVTGLWTAALAMFLILTGLPWASLWGDLLRRGTDMVGIGYPDSHRGHGTAPVASPTAATAEAGPWTLAKEPVPGSDVHAHHHGGHGNQGQSAPSPVSIDAVVGILADHGMKGAYRLTLPASAAGTFTAFTYPDRPQGQRTLYIDQYSGKVLRDVGFSDYGWAAQAVELGVQLHMGNYFGRLNQLVMLLPCIGIVVLSVTGPYMWWRRRPRGRLGAPRAIAEPQLKWLAVIVLCLAIVFPLAGASLLAVLVVDGLYRYAASWRIAHNG